MARQITKPGLTEGQHDALDHSGIPGVGGAETFTQEVHDLENHGSVPGVPDITGLLDESAHDGLDHAGLTGVPAAEAFTSGVHAVTDHDGLDGIGDVQWKAPVDEEADLPVNSYTTIRDLWAGNGASYLSGSWALYFTSAGNGSYRVKSHMKGTGVADLYIYTDNSNTPGSDTGITPVRVSGTDEDIYSVFSDVELTNGAKYWLVLVWVSGAGSGLGIVEAYGAGDCYQSSGDYTPPITDFVINTFWKPSILIESATINAVDGDTRYAKTEKTVWTFDGTNWNRVGGSVEAVTNVEESATPTALELKVNELLAVLRTAKIIST